ncbi:hypothetical protein FDI24_gp175 [Acidovorax phage ACP17]|uniref:Uncharacterized protein n=1 Tax=Acidovorax phage ACP17 TaxID=2010329 RepID=A0A218M339_9CAUD|nr:hypothetical protein FDI24_gp175 [Acidovorax phage ACP17]ASD50457.1 hypothetical protein [Acidovorax phage ACP17]
MTEEKNYVTLLTERAGTMGAIKARDVQKMLAKCGAGENSQATSKTVQINGNADYTKAANPAALAKLTNDSVAGVVVFWNEEEVMARTCDGVTWSVHSSPIEFPGFLTTMVIHKDVTRKEISSFRDMAATAPVRKIIVNAIRTIRANTDKIESQINAGDLSQLQTLCAALRDSVSAIEAAAKK